MTPEQTLTAAAQKLRALATAATEAQPAPWNSRSRYPHLDDDGRDRAHRLRDANGKTLLGGSSHAGGPFMLAPIGRYAALMHPGVGAALADWLDRAAARERAGEIAVARVYTTPAEQTAWLEDHRDHHALAVARQILGDQP